MGSVATKAKIAWDAIRTMYVGMERVRKAQANTLRCEFDALKFKDREILVAVMSSSVLQPCVLSILH
jgi:hypothetical protein